MVESHIIKMIYMSRKFHCSGFFLVSFPFFVTAAQGKTIVIRKSDLEKVGHVLVALILIVTSSCNLCLLLLAFDLISV